MESGLNADQNFYSRRPLPQTSEQQHHHLPHHQNYDLQPTQSRSPELPPKLPFLTTANLQSVTANGGYGGGLSSGGGDPDEFYREYRGVQQSSHDFVEHTTNGMPAKTSEVRPSPSSFRSNGNGTTPKHPPIPGARNNLKPSYRSASAPIDDRTALSNAKSTSALNGYNQPVKTSVKDLLKRFDQNNETSSSTARKPPPRIVTRESSTTSGPGYMKDRVGYQARTTGNNQTSGNPRAGVLTRDTQPGRVKSPSNNRPTQRTRFAPEDQHSNNTLSGVPRSSRPRNAVSSNTHASKSMTNLSPTSPTAPSQQPVRQPLFGEILPIGQDLPDIGYGIHAATRRTSDSSLHPTWLHLRSKSNFDISPSSPTAWYLGVTPSLEDVKPNKPRSSPGHNRNHSDFADTRVNTMNGVNSSFQSPLALTTSTSNTEPSRSTSKLPLSSARKTSIASESSGSPTSTRSNSPFATKALSNGKLRKAASAQRPWSPAGRATTPTNRTATPTSSRGKTRSPEKPTINTSSLKAYISAPPPKTSPPLRGSRQRQPVSAASTASSRQKAADKSGVTDKAALRSGSPNQTRTGMKLTRTGGAEEKEHKPRQIAESGPVNFAERRERIQRAYTKSIHESEQRAIRAQNLRRLQERQAREAAEKAAREAQAKEVPIIAEVTPEPRTSPAKPPKPLHISTNFVQPERPVEHVGNNFAVDQDSPTLGIPGSFVDDEPPASAISNITGTTEFDNEQQTEAPRESRPLSSQFIEWNDLSPQQASFGVDHGMNDAEGSIQRILDASPVEDHPQESTPTNDQFARDPSPPGAFKRYSEDDITVFAQDPSAPGVFRRESEHARDLTHLGAFKRDSEYARDPSPPGAFKRDSEYDQPVFATTITTASPKETTPEHSRAVTPLESGDESRHSSGDLSHSAVLHEREIHESGSSQIHPPPEILFHPEYEQSSTPESSNASRIQPMGDSALAPPSSVMNHVHDYLNTPVSEFGYESSDGYGVPNASDAEYDPYGPDSQMSPRVYRASHQSNWTDDSVETNEDLSEQDEYSRASQQMTRDTPTKPLPLKEFSPAVPPKPDGYSPQPSPLFPSEAPRMPSPNRHQLPPLSTGEGFGFGFSDRISLQGSSTLHMWPDYSPPPPPVPQFSGEASPAPPTRSPPPPSFYNRRPPSSLYHGSQNGSSRNIESRRASDDVYSPRASISTPRSSTQISLEDVSASQSFEAKEEVFETEEDRKAAEKLKKRLYQRKRLIQELIDTESVYLKDMNVVEEIYKGTAEACPKLDGHDVKAIFRNTDEIVAFSTMFLDELKSAGSSVYSTRSKRSRQSRATTGPSSATSPAIDDRLSIALTLADESDNQKDRNTFLGANFGKHLNKMQVVYTDYLKNSEMATSRLAALQADSAVQVWLSECNTVAKDLTQAWDLDALLVKPVQRITRYQLLLKDLLVHTPEDHPDHRALQSTCAEIGIMLKNIDELKKRIHMVGKIVGRKRKESDVVRFGITKAFARRDKAVSNSNRPRDDEVYVKLHEKYQDEFLRLQVVLRDVQYYTRIVTTWVNDFLRYLSSMELVMRLSASPYPEIESKWARFNMSMRDMGTVALEDHINGIVRTVIEPFEKVIVAYGPPSLAMKKRNKRRLDYERSLVLKGQGKKIDAHLTQMVDEYEALNETLKMELPKLSEKSKLIGNICLGHFVGIQTNWFGIWQDKVRVVLEENQIPKEIREIVEYFHRDFPYVEAEAKRLGIINGNFHDGTETRTSQSTLNDDAASKKGRPSNLSSRSRGLSVTSDKSPSLPTPDFAKRHSGQFTFSPIVATTPNPNPPQFIYQNQPYVAGHARTGSGSPATPDPTRSQQHIANMARPNTGRSVTSESGMQRLSTDQHSHPRRESGSTYNSNHVDGPLPSARPYSGLFHSAMPLPDGPEESQRSSRASSRDRNMPGGYNVLYLAASLFEFNISATKSEAGYPYLTYQAGEIFDVIGEKGELWLAKNQDDPSDQVGWIWSKHFARLATD